MSGKMSGKPGLLAAGLMSVMLAGCAGGIAEDSSGPAQLPREQSSADLQDVVGLLTELGARVEALEQRGAHLVTQDRGLLATLAGREVDVASLPVLEAPGSPVAIIEVTDYQCPYCRAHYQETLPLLKRELIDAGKVNYFVLDYPLPGHDTAALAAVAASCAADQRLFWQFHDRLFRLPDLPDASAISALGPELGADETAFRECLERGQSGSYVDRQRSLATGLGIRGTPTFLVGRLTEQGVVTDISVLAGRQTVGQFSELVEAYRSLP